MGESEVLLCPFCGAPYRELIPPGTVQVKCHYCGVNILIPPRLGGPIQSCPNHPESLAIGFCNGCQRSFCANCLFLVKISQSGGEITVSNIYFLCSKCKGDFKKDFVNAESKKYGGYFAACLYLLFIIAAVLKFTIWTFLILFLLFMTFVIILSFHITKIIGERYESMPTIIKFREKMQELNSRVESLKTTLTAEELYLKIIRGKWTRLDFSYNYKLFIDRRLEEYMQSGLDRKLALLKILSEDGLEIAPGLHIPPTLNDILGEIERESKNELRKQTKNTQKSNILQKLRSVFEVDRKISQLHH